MNIWRVNYWLENDYDNKTKLSNIFSILQLKHEKLPSTNSTKSGAH